MTDINSNKQAEDAWFDSLVTPESAKYAYEPPDYGRFAAESAWQVPVGMVQSAARAVRNIPSAIPGIDYEQDPSRSNFLERLLIERPTASQERYMQRYAQPGMPTKVWAESMQSLGYSGATALAAAGAAGATIATGGTGLLPTAAALVGGYGVAYGATRDQKLEELYNYANDVVGRKLSGDEWKRIVELNDFENKARAYGNYEAIPEVLADVLGYKLLRGTAKLLPKWVKGKLVSAGAAVMPTGAREAVSTAIAGVMPSPKTAIGKALIGVGRMGKIQLTEQTQELYTNYNQAKIDADVYGLEDPTLTGVFKDTAPSVALTTTILGIAGLGGGKAYDYLHMSRIDEAKDGSKYVASFKSALTEGKFATEDEAVEVAKKYRKHGKTVIAGEMDKLIDMQFRKPVEVVGEQTRRADATQTAEDALANIERAKIQQQEQEEVILTDAISRVKPLADMEGPGIIPETQEQNWLESQIEQQERAKKQAELEKTFAGLPEEQPMTPEEEAESLKQYYKSLEEQQPLATIPTFHDSYADALRQKGRVGPVTKTVGPRGERRYIARVAKPKPTTVNRAAERTGYQTDENLGTLSQMVFPDAENEADAVTQFEGRVVDDKWLASSIPTVDESGNKTRKMVDTDTATDEELKAVYQRLSMDLGKQWKKLQSGKNVTADNVQTFRETRDAYNNAYREMLDRNLITGRETGEEGLAGAVETIPPIAPVAPTGPVTVPATTIAPPAPETVITRGRKQQPSAKPATKQEAVSRQSQETSDKVVTTAIDTFSANLTSILKKKVEYLSTDLQSMQDSAAKEALDISVALAETGDIIGQILNKVDVMFKTGRITKSAYNRAKKEIDGFAETYRTVQEAGRVVVAEPVAETIKIPVQPTAYKLSYESAKKLLSLTYIEQAFPYGNNNISLRRDLIEELTGKKVPVYKAGATAVQNALLADAGIDKTGKAPAQYENEIRAWLETIVSGKESIETPVVTKPTTITVPAEEAPLLTQHERDNRKGLLTLMMRHNEISHRKKTGKTTYTDRKTGKKITKAGLSETDKQELKTTAEMILSLKKDYKIKDDEYARFIRWMEKKNNKSAIVPQSKKVRAMVYKLRGEESRQGKQAVIAPVITTSIVEPEITTAISEPVSNQSIITTINSISDSFRTGELSSIPMQTINRIRQDLDVMKEEAERGGFVQYNMRLKYIGDSVDIALTNNQISQEQADTIRSAVGALSRTAIVTPTKLTAVINKINGKKQEKQAKQKKAIKKEPTITVIPEAKPYISDSYENLDSADTSITATETITPEDYNAKKTGIDMESGIIDDPIDVILDAELKLADMVKDGEAHPVIMPLNNQQISMVLASSHSAQTGKTNKSNDKIGKPIQMQLVEDEKGMLSDRIYSIDRPYGKLYFNGVTKQMAADIGFGVGEIARSGDVQFNDVGLTKEETNRFEQDIRLQTDIGITGKPTLETIQEHINILKQAYNTDNLGVAVHIARTIEEIPERFIQDMIYMNRNRGTLETINAVLIQTSKDKYAMYIISNNIQNINDIYRIFRHELVGHLGLHRVFGDKLNPLLDEVYKYALINYADEVKQIGLLYTTQDTSTAEGMKQHNTTEMEDPVFQHRIADEILARLNTPAYANIETTFKQRIYDFIRRLFVNLMASIGVYDRNAIIMSNTEINHILERSREAIMNNRASSLGLDFASDVMLFGSPVRSQMGYTFGVNTIPAIKDVMAGGQMPDNLKSLAHGLYFKGARAISNYYAKKNNMVSHVIIRNNETVSMYRLFEDVKLGDDFLLKNTGELTDEERGQIKGKLISMMDDKVTSISEWLENPAMQKGMRPLLLAELDRLKDVINDINNGDFAVEKPVGAATSTLHKDRLPADYRYLDYDKQVSPNQQDVILNQMRKEKIPEILLYTPANNTKLQDINRMIRDAMVAKGTGTFSFTDVNTGETYTIRNWSVEEIKKNADTEERLRLAQEPVTSAVRETVKKDASTTRLALYKGTELTDIFYNPNDTANFMYSAMTPKANYADSRISGRDAYRNLADAFGSQQATSMFLLRANIDGMRMSNPAVTDINDDGYYNYVVFDTDAVTDETQVQMMMNDTENARYSPEVLEFFRDSKIRDKDGNLMVVYHGTVAPENFKEFNVGQPRELSNEEGVLERGSGTDVVAYLGSHFTNSIQVANNFAEEKGAYTPQRAEKGGRRIYPAFLNLKNPIYYDNYGSLTNDIMQIKSNHIFIDDFLQKNDYADTDKYDNDPLFRSELHQEILYGGEIQDNLDVDFAANLAQDFSIQLIERGYDGIIYKNTVDGGTGYIAFNPNQIKSIYNSTPTLSNDIMFMDSNNYSDILNTDPDEVTDKIQNVKQEYETQVIRNAAEATGENTEEAGRKLHKDYKDGNISLDTLESMNPNVNFNLNTISKVYHNLDEADRGFIPTTFRFMKDQWEGFKNRKEGRLPKPELTLFEEILSSVEWYAYKYPASRKIFESVLEHISERYQISSRILRYDPVLNRSYASDIEDLKSRNPAEYNKVNELLLRYDRDKLDIGATSRLEYDKLNDELLDAKFRLGNEANKDDGTQYGIYREIGMIEDKIKLARINIEVEQAESLRQEGLSEEGIRVWLSARQIFENSLRELINYGKVVIKQYEKDGRMVPEYIYKDDRGRNQKINLREALKSMGELVGSYFPRMRTPGGLKLHMDKQVAKNGTVLPGITKLYTSDIARATDVAKFRREGYTITDDSFSLVEYSPEDAVNFLSNITTIEDALTRVVNGMSGGLRSVAGAPGISRAEMHDYVKADGTIEQQFIVQTDSQQYRNIFKESGLTAQYYELQRGSEQKAWRFKGDQSTMEQRVLDVINQNAPALSSMKDEFLVALVLDMTDMLKAGGYRSSTIRRGPQIGEDVILGYEEDLSSVAAAYTDKIARGISKAEMIYKTLGALHGQYDENGELIEAKNFEDYADYLARLKENKIDPISQKRLYKAMVRYIGDQIRSGDNIDRMIGKLKSAAVLKYMAGPNIIASPMVNLTNLFMGIPAAMSLYGNIKLRNTPKLLYDALIHYKNFKLAHGAKTSDERIKYLSKIPVDIRILLSYIKENGLDVAQFNQEHLVMLQSKAGKYYNQMMLKGMWLFGKTEEALRVATIVGSYMGLKNNLPSDILQNRMEMSRITPKLFKQAEFISNRANALYGKVASPSYTQGPSIGAKLLKAGYTFLKFPHNYLNLIWASIQYDIDEVNKLYSKLPMGERIKKQFTREHAHGKKSAMYLMMAPMVLAGVGANPIYEIAGPMFNWILQAFFGADDPEEAIYQWLQDNGSFWNEFAQGGIVGAVSPVSLKRSLAIEVPTLKSNIVASMLGDITSFYKYAKTGDWARAGGRLLPRTIGSVERAYREYTVGATTSGGVPIFYGDKQIRPSLAEAIAMATGFTPSTTSRMKEEVFRDQQLFNQYQEERHGIYTRFRRYWGLPSNKRTAKELAGLLKLKKEYNDNVRQKRLRDKRYYGIQLMTDAGMRTARRGMEEPSSMQKARQMTINR